MDSVYGRDGNFVPITTDGITSTKSITLTGSNNTYNIPLFHITGSVEVRSLYGVITTDLGANHTASALRINDQTAQIYLTAVGGTDISAKKAGSIIVKKGVVATAITLIDNVAGAISEGAALETPYFTPVILVKKTGAVTDIEYHYATTDTPTSGVIQFFVRWLPLSQDAAITAI